MKWKRVIVVLLFLVAIVVAAVAVTLNFIATPEVLTPKVQEVAQKSLRTKISIKKVDYSLFSSFPNITLEIDSLSIAQSKDSISDLLSARHCELSINPFALLRKRLVIENVLLDKPQIYMYVDEENRPINHFIFSEAEPVEPADTTSNFDVSEYQMILKRFKIDSAQIVIDDRTREIYSKMSNLGVDVRMGISFSQSRARFDMGFDNLLVWKQGEILMKRTSMGLKSKVSFDRDSLKVNFKDAELNVNSIALKADGEIRTDSLMQDIIMDVRSSLNTPSLGEFLELIPSSYINNKEQMSTTGSVDLGIDVKGVYNDTSMPVVDARLVIKDGTARYASKKISLEKIACEADMHLDMNSPAGSYANIDHFRVSSSDILNFSLNGKVKNIINSPRVSMHLNSRVDFDRITDIFPLQDGVEVRGVNNSDLSAAFSVDDVMNSNFAQLYLEGESVFDGVEIAVDGKKFFKDSTSQAYLDMKIEKGKLLFGDRVKSDASRTLLATVDCSGLGYLSRTGESLSMSDLTLTAGANFDSKTSKINGLGIRGVAENTAVGIEGLFSAVFDSSDMLFTVAPKNEKHNLMITAKVTSSHLSAEEPLNNTKVNLSKVDMSLDMAKIRTKRWDVDGDVAFADFGMYTDMFPVDISIPNSSIALTNKSIMLTNARVKMGESELIATGHINNILQKMFVDPNNSLSGELKITSPYINASELVDAAFNSSLMAQEATPTEEGTSVQDTLPATSEAVPAEKSDSLPPAQMFRIPRDANFAFDLDVNKITFEDSQIDNLVGRATAKNGVLSLDKLSLYAIGAEATGSMSYRNVSHDRANVDLSLSLSQVDINRIGELMPTVNTMFPMLESFEGIVDFNLSANSDINSDYEFDISTLKSAMSFRGVNLVLMDSETFASLSKMLMFKNKKRNLIESIEAYAIVKQTKIDLLPFELSMDRYKAILGGTQTVDPATFDINFDYNVSILKSPLPFKAGVDLFGDLNDFDFKVTKAKLKNTNMEEQKAIYEAYRASIIPAEMEQEARRGEQRSLLRQTTMLNSVNGSLKAVSQPMTGVMKSN